MSRLSWYFHRLRAMSPAEMAQHARKKFRQFTDARRERDWGSVKLEATGQFPVLPKPSVAPEALREALQRDTEDILAGRWRAFGHLEIKVDDPPLWHCDYLVGKNLATTESAFKLNHRALPEGADVKLIWELSRWNQLVRLAQSAYVLGDERAGRKCIAWLEDWVKHNPPYRGWNWTSALEVGMRLIQFTWIDALLGESARRGVGSPSPRPSPPGRGSSPLTALDENQRPISSDATEVSPSPGGEGRGEGGRSSEISLTERMERLRRAILPSHVWFAWRHKSFGSSANNHLLGELTGLILATTRWPELQKWGASLDELQRRWEHEVLAQFAEDGGNKEQALNYQLFSFEFCWQARAALLAAGKKISDRVEVRLNFALMFFADVQMEREPWDYGDSDNAYVTPLFNREQTATREWFDWMTSSPASTTLQYWLGDPPVSPTQTRSGEPVRTNCLGDWWAFPNSGIAVSESGYFCLRFDASPLGYLQTAAHGHLDALHLSIWCKGVALVIDPGTGAYYADKKLRAWLASRAAHNGPCPIGEEFPKRLGPFLWQQHHHRPEFREQGSTDLLGELELPSCKLRRVVFTSDTGWQVSDQCRNGSEDLGFTVRWQFAPGARVKILSERKFVVNREDVSLGVEVSADWAEVKLVETEADRGGDAPLAGIVSPAFRKTCFAPYLLLTARPSDKPCVFRTTFLASALA